MTWPPRTMAELRKRVGYCVKLSTMYFRCSDDSQRTEEVADRIEADGPVYLTLVHPGGNIAWEGRRRSLVRALTEGGFALTGHAVEVVARIAFEDVKDRLAREYGFYPALDWWMVLRLPDAYRRWLREQAPPDHRDALVPPDSERRNTLQEQLHELLDGMNAAAEDAGTDEDAGETDEGTQ